MYFDKGDTSGDLKKMGGPVVQELATQYVKDNGPVYFGGVGITTSG